MSIMTKHTICWVDIPVLNIERAQKFYSGLLGTQLDIQNHDGMQMMILPHTDESVGGCLYLSTDVKPSEHGPLIYFSLDARLDEALTQVASLGGNILEPKKAIGPYGYRAVVIDSEGNRIALHTL